MSLISQTQAFVSVTDMQGNPSQTFQRGFEGQVSGFNILKSNNVPIPALGADGNGSGTSNAWALQFGHPMGLTYGEQITQTEALRLQTTMADGVRGLHVYGAKMTRPDVIGVAYVAAADRHLTSLAALRCRQPIHGGGIGCSNHQNGVTRHGSTDAVNAANLGLIQLVKDGGVAQGAGQAADATNGNVVPDPLGPNRIVAILVTNGDTSPHTIILRAGGNGVSASGGANPGVPFEQATVGDLTVSVAASGGAQLISLGDTDRYTQADGSLSIDWSAATPRRSSSGARRPDQPAAGLR